MTKPDADLCFEHNGENPNRAVGLRFGLRQVIKRN